MFTGLLSLLILLTSCSDTEPTNLNTITNKPLIDTKLFEYFIASPENFTMKQVSERMKSTKQKTTLNGAYLIPVIITTTSDFYSNPSFLAFADEITNYTSWYTSKEKGSYKLPKPFFGTTHLNDKDGYWNFNEATSGRGELICQDIQKIKALPPGDNVGGVIWQDTFTQENYTNVLDEMEFKNGIFFIQTSDNTAMIGDTDISFQDGFSGIYLQGLWHQHLVQRCVSWRAVSVPWLTSGGVDCHTKQHTLPSLIQSSEK